MEIPMVEWVIKGNTTHTKIKIITSKFQLICRIKFFYKFQDENESDGWGGFGDDQEEAGHADRAGQPAAQQAQPQLEDGWGDQVEMLSQ